MKRRRRRGRGTISSKKPNLNAITERVKKVGPEHFGILAIDPSKKICACHLTNFYGEILMPMIDVEKNISSMNAFIGKIERIIDEYKLGDLVVGLEMSGSYYHVIKRILKKRWTVDMIHPFTTKQLRQPASSGIKTDDRDLDAITRGMIGGYSFEEAESPPIYGEWRLFSRIRKDLVRERANHKLRCMERIEAVMPGYTSIFDGFWYHRGAVELVRIFGGAKRILDCGLDDIRKRLRERSIIINSSTVHKIFGWARNAPEPAPHVKTRRRIIRDELEIMARLSRKITEYEYELLKFLAANPAVVLLGIQGVNVVSASEYVSELGVISNYINPKRITGRAGIFPSRIQSADLDLPDGPLVRGHNVRLRAAIMSIGYRLAQHNPFFQGWTKLKHQRYCKKGCQQNEKESFVVSVASKFVRISFNMLAGHQVFNHPQGGRGEAVLPKIIDFCKERKIKLEKKIGRASCRERV